MADEQRNKIKLNVRVSRSKKEEWKDALEDGESLSSLVQRAVDREINHDYVPIEAVEQTERNAGPDEGITQLSDRLDEVYRSVAAVNSKIDTLAASGDKGDSDDTESIDKLAMDILPRLPTYPRDIPKRVRRDMEGTDGMGEKEYIEFIIEISQRADTEFELDGSAQRFANEMREPDHRTRQALLYIEQETTENVYSAIIDGTRHWMRF